MTKEIINAAVMKKLDRKEDGGWREKKQDEKEKRNKEIQNGRGYHVLGNWRKAPSTCLLKQVRSVSD